MQVRQQSSTGDYTMGLPWLANSPDAVALCVRTRLLLSLGEWFLDLSQGTPWFDGIMGKLYQANYDALIKNVILNSPGVTNIVTYSSSLNEQAVTSPTPVNLIPDTVLLNTWTTDPHVSIQTNYTPLDYFGPTNAFQYIGTGSPEPDFEVIQANIPVTPGTNYQFSGYIDATYVTSGDPIWALEYTETIDDTDYNIINYFAAEPGEPGMFYYFNFIPPPGVTSVNVWCGSFNNLTVTPNQRLIWGQPMLQVSPDEQASNYYTPYTTQQNQSNGRALTVSCTIQSLYSGIDAIELSIPLTGNGCLFPFPLTNVPNPTQSYSLSYRQLSASGDYTMGLPFLSNSPATVAQAVLTRLRLLTGEWFLDTSQGTPWGAILGQKVPTNFYDVQIQNAIVNTPGVLTITSYTSSIGESTAAAQTAQTNLIPDSDWLLGNEYWSPGDGGLIPILNNGGSTSWSYIGTGVAAIYVFSYSVPIPVVPGTTYNLSGYVDATNTTDGLMGGTPGWYIFDDDITVLYAGAGQASNTKGRLNVTWTCPPGVTSVRVLCDTSDSVTPVGELLTWSQPMLSVGAMPRAYVANPGSIPFVPNSRNLNISASIDTLFGSTTIESTLSI